MSLGIECLLTDDTHAAKEMADQLDKLNKERRLIQADMQEQAAIELDDYLEKSSGEIAQGICLFNPEWHQGVIGILAAKVKETFNRPVIAFAKESDDEEGGPIIKGSARSISGLTYPRLPGRCKHVLIQVLILTFGGHAMAAGFNHKRISFRTVSLIALTRLLKNIFHWKTCRIYVCLMVSYLQRIILYKLAAEIQSAGPWGQTFPEPVFEGRFTVLDTRIVGGNHLKLKLQADNKVLEAIAFNMTDEGWPAGDEGNPVYLSIRYK